MDAMTPTSESLAEYRTWVSVISENSDSLSWGDMLWALLARDQLHDTWETLSNDERKQVEELDNLLRANRSLLAPNLPSRSSTPRARAQGRWWWFLNE